MLRELKKTIVVSGGVGVVDLSVNLRGIINTIAVYAATSTTRFRFALIRLPSRTLWEVRRKKGEFSHSVSIPLISSMQLKISNASKDESFDVYLYYEEAR